MFKHDLKISIRSILKDRSYSLINTMGLTIAVTCCFLFIFWIRYELSFENCHPNADRIYQVQDVELRADGIHKRMKIEPPVYRTLKTEYPFIEEAICVSFDRMHFLTDKGNEVMMVRAFSQTNFFTLFPLPCVAGVIQKNKERSVYISEIMAEQVFGSAQQAVGKTLAIYEDVYTIDGVLSVSPNTHVFFDLLVLKDDDPMIDNFGGIHYILVKRNYRIAGANTYLTKEQQQKIAHSLSKMRESKFTYQFQPLKDIHLYTDDATEKQQIYSTYYGDMKQICLFAFVALLILVMAIINYVNTSTARAMNRSREVGIRKVMGAERNQLVIRFLTESFIISLVAVVLAVDLARLLVNPFSEVMGNWFSFQFDGVTALIVVSVCMVTTLLSGGYAAFYLSSFSPVKVLKGTSHTGSRKELRKVLMIVQLTLVILILICTTVIYRQLDYIFSKDLGFDRTHVYMLDTSLWYGSESFQQELCRNPYIVNASMSSTAPFNVQWGYSGVDWQGNKEENKSITFAQIFCDYRYAATFGFQMVEGEFIQPKYTWWQWTTPKSFSIVINESFRKILNVPQAIGTTITYYPYGDTNVPVEGVIIGVVKDFHVKPLQNDIPPLIISFNPEVTDRMFIKIKPENRAQTLQYIKDTYNRMKKDDAVNKSRPFMLTPLDREYEQMYLKEVRLEKLLMLFSFLSIAISIMGIFSMISFLIEKRTREVAIRKINGATVRDILWLFGKEFSLQIGLSSLIALPVAALLLNRWMEQYAYRVSSGWWVFLLIPLLIAGITAATIFIQIRKAARQNPVDSIKVE